MLVCCFSCTFFAIAMVAPVPPVIAMIKMALSKSRFGGGLLWVDGVGVGVGVVVTVVFMVGVWVSVGLVVA